MPLDRAAALRQAEKLVRQGKLDQAIGEYFTVVEDQPRDWNTANLLGDLLVRAGRLDEAIDQFGRCADTLRSEGFLPKAAALYKKILKIRPLDDRALLHAGELASQQGLLADARTFLRAAVDARQARNDQRGVLEVVVRLGMLDRTDVAARIAGARARAELGDPAAAIRELSDVAAWLVDEGREADALAPLREIVHLDPRHAQATAELGRILVGQGDLAAAAQYLGAEGAGASPALGAAAAEARIRAGADGEALEIVDRLIAGEAEGAIDAVVRLAAAVAPEFPEPAFHTIERVVDACVAKDDWKGAARALRAFVSAAPGHVPALVRMVDVCIDGDVDEGVVEAQALLADAYLAQGASTEARLVAEDLVRRQPLEATHLDRLRRALVLAGDPTPDETAAEWLAEVTAAADEDIDQLPDLPPAVISQEPERPQLEVPPDAYPGPLETASAPLEAPSASEEPWQPEPSVPDVRPAAREPQPPAAFDAPVPASAPNQAPRKPLGPHAIDLDALLSGFEPPAPPPKPGAPPNVEVDLSVALDDIKPRAPVVPKAKAPAASPPPPAPSAAPIADIEEVFRNMRDEAERKPSAEAAEVSFSRGKALYEAGAVQESIEPLRAAARVPTWRYAAAALLARVFRDRQQTADAIEWLGHAADAPVRDSAERYATLLQLADLLEATGETERALGVCLELQAEAGDYEDVGARIARLTGVTGGG